MQGGPCNLLTNKKWSSKIYYTCDRKAGLGQPRVQDRYDCVVIFDWRTDIVCTEEMDEITLAPLTPSSTPPPKHEKGGLPLPTMPQGPKYYIFGNTFHIL